MWFIYLTVHTIQDTEIHGVDPPIFATPYMMFIFVCEQNSEGNRDGYGVDPSNTTTSKGDAYMSVNTIQKETEMETEYTQPTSTIPKDNTYICLWTEFKRWWRKILSKCSSPKCVTYICECSSGDRNRDRADPTNQYHPEGHAYICEHFLGDRQDTPTTTKPKMMCILVCENN